MKVTALPSTDVQGCTCLLCSPKAPAPEHPVRLFPALRRLTFSVQGAEELECHAEEAVKLTAHCQPGCAALRPVSGVVTHTLQGGGRGGPGPKCQGTGAGWRSTCVPRPLSLAVPESPPRPPCPILRPWLSVCKCSLGGWGCSGLQVHAQWTTQSQGADLRAICGPGRGRVCSGPPGSPACWSLPSLDSPPMLKIGIAGLALCAWVSSWCGRSRGVLGRLKGARPGVRNLATGAQRGLWLQPVLC